MASGGIGKGADARSRAGAAGAAAQVIFPLLITVHLRDAVSASCNRLAYAVCMHYQAPFYQSLYCLLDMVSTGTYCVSQQVRIEQGAMCAVSCMGGCHVPMVQKVAVLHATCCMMLYK